MNFYLTVFSFLRSELALLQISPYVYFGIGIVALLLLVLALRSRKSNAAVPAVESASVSSASPAVGDDDLIAVIAAAVYAFGESTGKTLAIRSIRAKDRRTVWASTGVYENTRPF